jgi:hypothetical protein
MGHEHDWVSVGIGVGYRINIWAPDEYAKSGNSLDGENVICGMIGMRSKVGVWGDGCFTFTLQMVNGSRPAGFMWRTGGSYHLGRGFHVLAGIVIQYRTTDSVWFEKGVKDAPDVASILHTSVKNYGAMLAGRLFLGRFMVQGGLTMMGEQAIDAHNANKDPLRAFVLMGTLDAALMVGGH